MQANALDLRKGNLVRYNGALSEVVYWNILKNDRRQFVQMRIKNLDTGRIAELKEHGDSKFEVLENDLAAKTGRQPGWADAQRQLRPRVSQSWTPSGN